MSLIGNTYVTSSDPGAVGFGYQWSNISTGDMYARNVSNTAWTLIGNANQVNLGLAPKSGFAATGAVTGVSGWAPVDSPDFSTSAKLDGISLATVNDVTNLSTNMYSTIQSLIAQAMSSYVTSTSAQSNVCVLSGLMDFDDHNVRTIPLPVFESDTKMATESQCKWTVSPILIKQHDYTGGSEGNTCVYFRDAAGIEVDPTKTRTFKCVSVFRDLTWWNKAAYLIIGVR